MPQITIDTHPIEEGWLHTTIDLHTDELLEREKAESLVCFSFGWLPVRVEDYEIALCEQDGLVLRGCVRLKAKQP